MPFASLLLFFLIHLYSFCISLNSKKKLSFISFCLFSCFFPPFLATFPVWIITSNLVDSRLQPNGEQEERFRCIGNLVFALDIIIVCPAGATKSRQLTQLELVFASLFSFLSWKKTIGKRKRICKQKKKEE